MSVKQFEDKRWAKDSQVISFRHEAALSMVDQGKVLDIGSGDGLFLSLLKQKGIEGEGLDISEEGVAKTRAKGLTASLFDFNDPIPFADNTFDTVVMLDVLEHFYAPDTLLKEAVRVSKRFVIISVPNFNSLPARIQVLRGSVPENNRPNKGHIYWFNWKVLHALIEKNGLCAVTLRANAPWESVPIIGVMSKALAHIFPNLFALSFVVQAKKV